MATSTRTRIGVVGPSHMGGNMAAHFLAEYPVYGEERNRAAAKSLEHEGLQRKAPGEAEEGFAPRYRHRDADSPASPRRAEGSRE
jgi:3-hydroxyacyl-CoA dehydrogenase